MQFGFCPGKGTTDAIFIVRQVQEKLLGKRKELWMAFVDLEKAFDRVPREVLWWALTHVGVEEWMVNVIKSLYEGVRQRSKRMVKRVIEAILNVMRWGIGSQCKERRVGEM